MLDILGFCYERIAVFSHIFFNFLGVKISENSNIEILLVEIKREKWKEREGSYSDLHGEIEVGRKIYL
jgi:hypothetical protein